MVDGELGDTQEVRTMTDSASEATGRIFISYRRQDSAYPAGWLYDRLAERFGPEQIFKDIDSIELGDDFVDTITRAVGSCDILLALIGQEWLDITGADGTRRLDDPDDFVRLEIEAALERKVLLIPILVDGAVMPRGDDLPPSIAALVRRHALELSPNRFRADTDRLLETMERTLTGMRDAQTAPMMAVEEDVPETRSQPEPEPEQGGWPASPTLPEPRRGGSPTISRRPLLIAAAAVAVVVAVIAIVMNLPGDDRDEPARAAATPPELGPGGPTVLAHRGGDEEFAWQTIPAFEHAARIGAQVEVDVRWTSDGVAVLVHDPGTTPGIECEGGNLIVADTEWSELDETCRSSVAASKNGKQYGIPTFAEGVAAVAKVPGAEIYAEVKVKQSSRQVRHFIETIKNARMIDRAVVMSSKPAELAKIRAEAEAQGEGDLRTMLFFSGQRLVPADLAAQDLWGAAVKFDLISKAYVKDLNDAGLQVMMWIVNSPELWKQAIDVGADLILTDKPVAYGTWFEAS